MTAMPPVGGRYEVKETLGAGGFAMVYRAHDPVLDREIALKVLHSHLARDQSIRSRFVREGRVLARVRHPNMVQVHDAGESGDTAYLAMELVEGQSLEAILDQRGPLSLDETLTITAQIASALEAIHARHLVHRDVKPSNILIEDGTGRAVLLDLGVARDMTSATVTSSIVVGTPGFMAPEQVLEDGSISAQTDVYQLAATVYVMLSGQAPFVGESMRVMNQVVSAPPPELSGLRPDLPPAVVATIAEGMAKNPERRPRGARAFADLLQASTTIRPAPAVSPPPATVQEIESAVTIRVDPRTLAASAGPAAGAGPSAAHPVVVRPVAPAARRRVLPFLIGGLGALAAVALGAGVIIARGGDGDGGSSIVGVTVTPSLTASPSPSPTPAITPTPSPSPSPAPARTGTPAPTATRTATAAPTGTVTRTPTTTVTPTGTPAPVPTQVETNLRTRMLLRQYRPEGPIITVATSSRNPLYVQKGICIGASSGRCQIVFIFHGTEFLGTDTFNASAGIRSIAPAGRDRFTITYANYAPNDPAGSPSLPDVTITYTWDGTKTIPSGTPPGH